MAEPPVYATDAAICRLLAEGPLPTAAIAARLAIPERTARHRLRQLRRSGTVVTGTDGLHRLAAPVVADLAATTSDPAATGDLAAPAVARDHPASGVPSGEDGGGWTVLLAIVAIGLAAVAVARRSRRDPPPAPAWGFGNAGGWEPRPPW
jgi:hypothetical protein